MSNKPNIKIKKINHVGIPINDRKKSFELYKKLLGLTIIPSMVDEKHVIWSKTSDGTMVHLIEPKDGPGNPLPNSHVSFEVENFEETVEILKNSSWEIINGPGERYDGQKFVYIQDDDGNMLEFNAGTNSKHSNIKNDEWGYTKNP
jgi:catechol 2,3-dioxygenase-like lactoylglutathione lyase family enzyme